MVEPSSSSSQQPLGLTVYDLPAPEDTLVDPKARTRKGRLMLMLVVLICAAPILASYWTYYVIKPQGTRQYGDLIEPPRMLPTWNATDLQGQTVSMSSLKDQWLFVSIGSGQCDSLCEKRLFVQRQLHKILNKDSARVERVWLITDSAIPKPELIQALQGATVLKASAEQVATWLEPASGHTLDEHLYVVDPMGRWMMRFPTELNDKSVSGMKRDLERLLRASNSWDQPGRPVVGVNP